MTRDDILEAIKKAAQALGHVPSRAEFRSHSQLSEYRVLEHFPNWRDAVRAAGFEPVSSNVKLDDAALLRDWAEVVRKLRRIPTRDQYRREGRFSVGVFEKHFGPWSALPEAFRKDLGNSSTYSDVVALLPVRLLEASSNSARVSPSGSSDGSVHMPARRYPRLEHRPTYGNPLDFRGLRHEPVNEQGVVFLFGIVSRELGYLVEAVQEGFPDCEAKRQIGPGKWQRVRIEFEYESRSFREHGHAVDGCDIIVCWRHNWPECPPQLEVVELSSVIKSLPKSEE